MMKLRKRFISAVLSVMLLTCAAGCQEQSSSSLKSLVYSKVKVSSSYDGGATVCENENWRLLWNGKKKQISFLEKQTGNIWSPLPVGTETVVYDEDGMPIKNNPLVESSLVATYYDPSNLSEREITSVADVEEVYTQQIENGLRVIYDFAATQILIPVEYTIEEDHFSVSVNTKHIADNGKNFVTTVSLAPFMCGIKNDTHNSWLFMPDGSGALLSVNSLDTVGNYGEKSVYGDDLTDQKFNYLSKTEQVNMPVYGMKTGNRAIFAIIESGAEQASICWNIGSLNMGYSAIYSKFKVRGYTTIKSPRGFSSYLDAKEVKYFAKYRSENKFSVAYYSLSDTEAQIGSMAKIYRNYLENDEELTEKQTDAKAMFRFVGAVEQPDFVLGVPTSKLFELTTTENAEKMTDELSKLLNGEFLVSLAGFGSSGLDVGKLAGGYTVSSKLGGKSGMKKLSAALKKSGIEMFVDFDLISYSKSGGGFNKNDAARFPDMQNAWFTDFDTVTRNTTDNRFYILSRNRLTDAAEKLASKAKGFGVEGISLDSLSHTVYSDYYDRKTAVCADMSGEVSKLFKTVKNAGYKTLSVAANDYAAIASDRVSDVPLYSSNYDVAYTDVPFYQLVFKGYIPMNSVSLNVCADEKDAQLRCVESGTTPSYTFIYNYDNELITSDHSFLFGSDYNSLKNKAAETVNGLQEYFESINGAKIERYEMLDNLIRITVYDNGIYAAVNYSDSDAETAYGKIPSNGFITGRSED